jgi:heavy metal sensor kinase
MLESLRGRLLVFYTATLAAVIVVFGASVAFLTWRARLAVVDASLRVRAEAIALALQPASGGTFDLELPPRPDAEPVRVHLYHVIWDADGRLVDRSDPDLDVPRPAELSARTRAGRREVAARAPAGATVVAGRDLADVRGELWSLARTIGGVGGVALVLSLAGGWWLVGRALAPIGRIGRTAQAMTEGDFAARIPIDRVETELGQVARALNDAFDRLHASLERQRRFTADASHELRTPLSTLSTELQWALARERQPAEYRESLEASLRAVGRMTAVVERLLALARTEAAAPDRREPVAIDHVIEQAAADLESLARRRGVTLNVDRTSDSAGLVEGDADRLREALANVIANAVQYNIDGGRVDVHLRRDDGQAEIVVSDTGIGIPAEDLPRVFEPFFRADPARSRDAGGAGLGLAVTHGIITRHGGTIACASSPGAGTTMTVRLPYAGPSGRT